eukprot:CAMPEP_0119133262 /NCGR_PEP_ID=MMETSP1310-20130426/13284_1 /TAXON_ID=464262 /ORGANISM="Genus nov. species nov., Strain RCC2339" /LENGTH=611 /DNA_ID=CAMNT_0007123949 /DNA_START=38 /DNA_END=1873 /DNA_ORIENTATION=+
MAKSSSKRMTLRSKYKIKKKVAEHNRQQRKASNKAKALGIRRNKTRKDPGIPNLYPLKKEALAAIEKRKEEEEEAKQAKRERRKLNRLQGRESEFEELRAKADSQQAEYESKQALMEEDTGESMVRARDGSAKAYFKEFRRVVDESDVILEVLDARDPLGCRCREIEQWIRQRDPNKRIVLVLNKIDMVPKANGLAWLTFLRTQYPTIAFKASTQKRSSRLGWSKVDLAHAKEHQLKSQVCFGADTLLKLLKNYTRNKDIKTGITVGVIGYPNVGKSSLINSLSRNKVADVGATPGVTTRRQEIMLDKHIKLMDCPGIVFSSRQTTDTGLLLRSSSVKVEQMEDPTAVSDSIVRQCGVGRLVALYSVAEFDSPREFLRLLAEKRGKYRQRGVPDYEAMARSVIEDWNAGKVPFFTVPPELPETPTNPAEQEEAAIVSTWAKEFDIDALLADGADAALPASSDASDVVMGGVQLAGGSNAGVRDEQMSLLNGEGKDVATPADIGIAPLKRKRERMEAAGTSTAGDGGLNLQVNRQRRREEKERKRMRRREDAAVADSMVDEGGETGGAMADEAYDFMRDFQPASFVPKNEDPEPYAGSGGAAAMVDEDLDYE